MLAGAILAAIFAGACLGFGLADQDLGLRISYHVAAGALGLVASTLFLVWNLQTIFR